MVAGMPPVEPTLLKASLALPLDVEFVRPSPTELVGVGSVGGETTIVLAMITVVTSGSASELALVKSVNATESVVPAELLESTAADEIELTNVGRSVKLAKRSLNDDSLFVVSVIVSNGVDCEAGDAVVMVMFIYWRFT
jgi:hypothetical protein